jgi:hypothetical protein
MGLDGAPHGRRGSPSLSGGSRLHAEAAVLQALPHSPPAKQHAPGGAQAQQRAPEVAPAVSSGVVARVIGAHLVAALQRARRVSCGSGSGSPEAGQRQPGAGTAPVPNGADAAAVAAASSTTMIGYSPALAGLAHAGTPLDLLPATITLQMQRLQAWARCELPAALQRRLLAAATQALQACAVLQQGGSGMLQLRLLPGQLAHPASRQLLALRPASFGAAQWAALGHSLLQLQGAVQQLEAAASAQMLMILEAVPVGLGF